MTSEDIKLLIQEAINNYCFMDSINKKEPTKGELFAGIKPYAICNTISLEVFAVEIYINEICVFRIYREITPDSQEHLQMQCLKQTLIEVLMTGISGAKTTLLQYYHTRISNC